MKTKLFVVVGVIALAIAVWVQRKEVSPTRSAGVVLQLRTFALNVDPATMADIDSRKVATLLYTGLVAVDQDGTIRPRVARSWKRADANTWEFTLADGQTFSNGAPVTASKVVASLCASMQPEHVQSWSLNSIERTAAPDSKSVGCTGLVAKDSATVLIRETMPTPWLMEALSGPGGWIVDTAAKAGAYGVRPGTGAYAVEAVTPDKKVLLKQRQAGAAIKGQAPQIEFDYVPDAALAAKLFESGGLDLVEIDSPQLVDLLLTPQGTLRTAAGRVVEYDVDRIRVVSFNLDRLAKAGLNKSQLSELLWRYYNEIARPRIGEVAQGLAEPLLTGFPPYAGTDAGRAKPPSASGELPTLVISLITENDPFSDRIGAFLPNHVGGIRIAPRAMEKSLLISALLKGDYDAALLKIEATHRTPMFWASFFMPGNPYAVFGTPLQGMKDIDLAGPEGIERAAKLIDSDGNWIGLMREIGKYAISPHLSGIRVTGSGQLSLEELSKSQ